MRFHMISGVIFFLCGLALGMAPAGPEPAAGGASAPATAAATVAWATTSVAVMSVGSTSWAGFLGLLPILLFLLIVVAVCIGIGFWIGRATARPSVGGFPVDRRRP